MDRKGTQTNGPEDKEIVDAAQGFTLERQTTWIKKRRKRTNQHLGLRWHINTSQQVYIKKSKIRLITVANNSIDNIRTGRTATKTKKRNEVASDKLIEFLTEKKNLDMASKEKPQKQNWISSYKNTKTARKTITLKQK